MKHKIIIICGSSRAGKTTLAKIARKYSQSYKGLVFEGLFPAYFSRLSYLFPKYHKALAQEYFERPRFIDEKKSETLTPSQQLGKIEACEEGFLPSLYKSFGDQWVIADLHAELYYRTLFKAWPTVHLCVVIRDPRDCVCAGLYWQTFPKVCNNRKGRFYNSLFAWLLSVNVAKQIQKEYPENVTILNSNAFHLNDGAQILLDLKEGWKDVLPNPPYYSFVENGHFTIPIDGRSEELLGREERAVIQGLCGDIMREYNYTPEENLPPVRMMRLRVIKNLMLMIAKISPSLARGFFVLLFSPHMHVTKQFERLKQFIKDVKNF